MSTSLVTEEHITRTNVWAGEFSPSSLIDATCPRKFLWNRIFGLKMDKSQLPLVYGSAIHKGVETFYKLRNSMDWEAAAKECIEAFCVSWSKANVSGDRKRSAAVGIKTLGEYCRTYRNDIATFVPELVECDQWIDMPNGTSLLVKIDRVRNDNGFYTVCDTKTTTRSLTDYYFRQYENDLKVSLYFYTVMQVLGQCDSIQIDGITVPYPDIGSTKTPFARRNFMRTEEQIADAINTYCKISDSVVKNLTLLTCVGAALDIFYCNQHNCTDFSGCSLLELCKYHFKAPDLRCNIIATNPLGEKILAYAQDEMWQEILELEIKQEKEIQHEKS